MSHIDFFKLPDSDKADIFNKVSELSSIPFSFAIEKDWWVSQTLRVLYGMTEIAPYLTFKGGTSLSKAWGIIDRFSEDIDIVLDQEFLGFEKGILSKSQVKKLRYVANQYFTKEFLKRVEVGFREAGFDTIDIELDGIGDSDQDPIAIMVRYPSVIIHPPYLLPRVKIEIGARGIGIPATSRGIQSLVGVFLSDSPFADTGIMVPSVNPERTYLEKLFLLHEVHQQPIHTRSIDRMSRHLYDIWKLSQTPFAIQAYDKQLIWDVIEHRSRFGMTSGLDFNLHYPPHLVIVPPNKEILDSWAKDYSNMQRSMIYGESPSFKVLVETLNKVTEAYNTLSVSPK